MKINKTKLRKIADLLWEEGHKDESSYLHEICVSDAEAILKELYTKEQVDELLDKQKHICKKVFVDNTFYEEVDIAERIINGILNAKLATWEKGL